jgi:hypothetical protein
LFDARILLDSWVSTTDKILSRYFWHEPNHNLVALTWRMLSPSSPHFSFVQTHLSNDVLVAYVRTPLTRHCLLELSRLTFSIKVVC